MQYDTIIAKFDSYFKVSCNAIFVRVQFSHRCQHYDESAEQYITALYSLIETCKYGELKLKEELLRDSIVIEIKDPALSKRLQLDPELSIEKANTAVCQKEAVKEHQSHMHGEGMKNDLIVLDELRSCKPPKKGAGCKAPGPRQKRTGKMGSRGANSAAAKPVTCIHCRRNRHPEGDH